MPTDKQDPQSTPLDPIELAALKLAIRHGLYLPDLSALVDILLDDPSLLDDVHARR